MKIISNEIWSIFAGKPPDLATCPEFLHICVTHLSKWEKRMKKVNRDRKRMIFF